LKYYWYGKNVRTFSLFRRGNAIIKYEPVIRAISIACLFERGAQGVKNSRYATLTYLDYLLLYRLINKNSSSFKIEQIEEIQARNSIWKICSNYYTFLVQLIKLPEWNNEVLTLALIQSFFLFEISHNSASCSYSSQTIK
jgi:hypothetical protein